jgi:acyl-CoA synthetase (AMP-forming)/AMP-acid ligase II
MNDFKYQEKPLNSEKEMNAFKDFDTVLKKHKAIRNSYSKAWKIALAASASLGLLAGLFVYNQKEQQLIESDKLFKGVSNKVKTLKNENNTIFAVSKKIKSQKTVEEAINKEVKISKRKEDETISVKKQFLEIESVENNEQKRHSKENSVLTELPRKKTTNNWYQLKEIETNKTWVPTLYVSKLEWPEKLTQSELTRFPSINAIYKSVAKEIPIVDGLAYITKRNSKKRPKGYKISGNNFSPNLIRALHKAEKKLDITF